MKAHTHLDQQTVMQSLAPRVEVLMAEHLADRKNLWWPQEVLTKIAPSSKEPKNSALVPKEAVVAIALNLLTEEGLPHFHRLVASHLGEQGVWASWNNLWTAEEDRHGALLHDYVRDYQVMDIGALEKMQYAYLVAGFQPAWGSEPYRLLAYTSLQERATQMAHANTGRYCALSAPSLQKAFAHISSDEGRHYRFYRGAFEAVLDVDVDNALVSLLAVMPNLSMPGASIPDYNAMTEIVYRAGIYGPRHYAKIASELLAHWHIAERSTGTAAAKAAQKQLLAVPARLERIADILDKRKKHKTFRLDILNGELLNF